MRINVYAEELTDETELVTKTVTDDKFGTRTFYGVRVYLKSPPELHADPADDDRTAITIWVPWTREGGHDFHTVAAAINGLLMRLSEAFSQDRTGVGPEDHHRQIYTNECSVCKAPWPCPSAPVETAAT